MMKTLTRRHFLQSAALGAIAGSVASSCCTQKASPTGKSARTEFLSGCPQSVREALTGPCASVRHPFDYSGAIDFPALRQQVEFVLQAGTKVAILTWGDSLYSLLTDDEIARLYWQAVEKKDFDDARAVIRDCDQPLFDFLLKLEGGFDAGVHGLLEAASLGTRYRRPPYHSLTDAQMAGLKQFLKRYS
jgi:dihydrodipicolinate synthase/N-acetylneuraminate lyase